MPTFSDEDGLTDVTPGAGSQGRSTYDSDDTEAIPPVSAPPVPPPAPPTYPAEAPYDTGVYNADPYSGDPYAAEAYNSTDILPTSPPGGRRARREAAAAAAAAPPPAPEPQEYADTPPYTHGPADPDPAAYGAPVADEYVDGNVADHEAYADDAPPPSDGEPPRRRDWTPTPLGRVVLPLALALVSIVALWAAWNHLTSGDQPSAAPQPSVSAPVGGDPSASNSASPASTASASTSTAPSASASTPASPSSAPNASASVPVTTPVTKVDRSVPVVVLNATQHSGLASKVAAQLRAKGWTVTSVGNWTRGGITATTIFLNGHVRAAATIKDDFPQAKGSIALPKPGMPPLRMVIVIGNDYPR